ncbi:MAG TPA: hypothetical protein DCR93_38665 [Cytophagales bacterium]|nr:hypothetical protein [Cytophagales bacterium]HAP65159.1 hypothetical protein [Cytophagales bacterium]
MPEEQRRPILVANGINVFFLLVIPILILIETIAPNSDPNIREFSLLLMILVVIISLIHLFISYLGLTHLSRLLFVVDFPLVIFLFPALSGNVGEQDLFWFPYLVAAFSIIPQLVLTIRYERVLYLLGMLYMLVLLYFSVEILLSSILQQSPVVQTAQKYKFYYLRSLLSVWVIINVPFTYLKWLLMKREKELGQLRDQVKNN